MKIKYQLNQLKEVSIKVSKNITQKVILITGEMGAGKTTLIKQILVDLNVIDNVSSPTFSIINEYKTKTEDLIYHMDLYRIDKIEELDGIGFFEYLESGNLCLIEWGEKIENTIGDNYDKFKIIKKGTLRIIEKTK
ncbi:MAG: tRNA (adenosine(37)-N6)-threonylcarbamoyltransferase complex ATPase subunit type 1 TsaE [Bacteroidota bacterium]|nr:tRNA (adenosine(37)-N6)-threonylcarbamoyltransferase complex ATPase subunit type 1 TsaE [Bacteroidota bacterium]|tara:strand:- start:655 stop:1062 length:408 start_codon:yes stop_codon:yes gene_type:complete